MAIYKGISLETPRSTEKGNGMVLVSQQVSVTAAPTISDTIRFGPFPAGIKPSHVKLVHGELDTGTDALRAKVGYSHADGSTIPVTSPTGDQLFGATLTTFNTASGAGGNDLAAGAPVEIQKDWYLDIVPSVTSNAMAATKTIHAVVFGEGVGAK